MPTIVETILRVRIHTALPVNCDYTRHLSSPRPLEEILDNLLELACVCRQSDYQAKSKFDLLALWEELNPFSNLRRRRAVSALLPPLQAKLQSLSLAVNRTNYQSNKAFPAIRSPTLLEVIELDTDACFQQIAFACDNAANELGRALAEQRSMAKQLATKNRN